MRESMKEAITESIEDLYDIGLIDDSRKEEILYLIEDDDNEEVEIIEQDQDYELQVYKGKKGYKWRFLINGDIKCTGSDWNETMDLAKKEAEMILETVWKLTD